MTSYSKLLVAVLLPRLCVSIVPTAILFYFCFNIFQADSGLHLPLCYILKVTLHSKDSLFTQSTAYTYLGMGERDWGRAVFLYIDPFCVWHIFFNLRLYLCRKCRVRVECGRENIHRQRHPPTQTSQCLYSVLYTVVLVLMSDSGNNGFVTNICYNATENYC